MRRAVGAGITGIIHIDLVSTTLPLDNHLAGHCIDIATAAWSEAAEVDDIAGARSGADGCQGNRGCALDIQRVGIASQIEVDKFKAAVGQAAGAKYAIDRGVGERSAVHIDLAGIIQGRCIAGTAATVQGQQAVDVVQGAERIGEACLSTYAEGVVALSCIDPQGSGNAADIKVISAAVSIDNCFSRMCVEECHGVDTIGQIQFDAFQSVVPIMLIVVPSLGHKIQKERGYTCT